MIENKLKVFGFIGLSFLLAIGILLIILSSALDGAWWTMLVIVVCVLVPIPSQVISCCSDSSDFSQPSMRKSEFGCFITSCIIVSSIALPIVLYHSSSIKYASMWMSVVGAITVNLSIGLYDRYYHFDEPEACI